MTPLQLPEVLLKAQETAREALWGYNWAIIIYSLSVLIVVISGGYIAMWCGRFLCRLTNYFDAKARREEMELMERARVLDEDEIIRRYKPTKKHADQDDAPYRPKM